MPNSNPSGSAKTQLSTRGAICHPLHKDRGMIMYLVHKNELMAMSMVNSQTTIWSSIGTGAFALFVACIWDLVTSPDVDWLAGLPFLFATLVVIAVSVGIVWWYHSNRKSLITTILQESTGDSESPED